MPAMQKLAEGARRQLGEAQRGAMLAGSWTPDWRRKVEWLEGQRCPKTPEAAEQAAKCDDALERLAWLRQRGYALGPGAVKEAAVRGDMAALAYLLAEGAPADDDAAAEAAGKGHLAALKALRAAGRPVDALWAAMGAALEGHLPVLVWLVEESGLELRLHYAIFARAVQCGSIELLEWLRARGCPWEPQVEPEAEAEAGATLGSALEYAARGGHEPSIEWLAERGCPVPADGMPYRRAALNGDFATLRCLRRLGVPWGPPGALFRRCMAEGVRPEALRWLVA
ncbi:hypothetical protein GPECTOR_222g481 [Gonium pectorale]|uniref:Ankyrin repeat domain-containing protein n=1 Tax=Gonium pectorale TaxID=33097 RepID=A0A150FWM0_GONPE|nr:hypothetical protein GPECTOR_222g481 [Gonium pectorale]|eukprot:KXZ42013.1 hypothetical protein GPECTOR_222g481 [Gonium pectorale]